MEKLTEKEHPVHRHPPGRGVIVAAPGGRIGWLARRWFPAAATRAYLAYIRLVKAGPTRRFIADFTVGKAGPWFSQVEIETINRCNGGCAFCPVNHSVDPRPERMMTEDLFAGLIRQLADIGYAGFLNLYSNNEPLLDPRLEDFASAARAALPGAFINLSTNGTLLGVDRLRKLLPHVDRIVVNNYHVRPELHEHSRRIRDFCLGEEGRALLAGKTLEISLRDRRDILTSRAGNAPNRPPPAKPPAIPCALPFSQLIIRPDGKVSLCCNDALGQVTLGDLAAQSLDEVWFGEAFQAVRRTMLEKGREGLPLCRACDFVKHDLHVASTQSRL